MKNNGIILGIRWWPLLSPGVTNFRIMSSTPTLDIAALRRNYSRESLSEQDVMADPIDQFEHWFRQAMDSELPEPNAMILASASAGGQPSIRTMLLKGFDHQGFVFYTNYSSRKGNELDANPQAALLFPWLELERQVRIEGLVERVSQEESLAYFQSRPRGSQIGAWASPQSQIITGRDILEAKVAELTETFKHDEVLPLPPYWGGYRLRPDRIEFWQGRESRLHDRVLFTRAELGWTIERLAP